MNKLVRSLFLIFPKAYELFFYLKNFYFLNLYFKKVHEEDYKAFPLFFEEETQIFLDIGANVGMTALSIFLLNPNAEVISFEPNPINYRYLENIANKFTNFQYHKIGLGDREEKLDFYYPVYNGKSLTALSSFEHKNAATWLNPKTLYLFDRNKLKVEQIRVDVKTLDSYNLKPNLIKIDVEGFEYKVLLGAKETIKRYRPILLIEGIDYKDRSYIFLEDNNYLAFKFSGNKFYHNDMDCANNFFIPKEKLDLIESYLD